MKFNVEMNKREIQEYLDKSPLTGFRKGLLKASKSLKRSFRQQPMRNIYFLVGLFFAVLIVFMLLKMTYAAGYNDAEIDQSLSVMHQQAQQTSDYFEDRSLKDTASWFAKKVLLALGNNINWFLMLIAIAWIVHGVGFRIL